MAASPGSDMSMEDTAALIAGKKADTADPETTAAAPTSTEESLFAEVASQLVSTDPGLMTAESGLETTADDVQVDVDTAVASAVQTADISEEMQDANDAAVDGQATIDVAEAAEEDTAGAMATEDAEVVEPTASGFADDSMQGHEADAQSSAQQPGTEDVTNTTDESVVVQTTDLPVTHEPTVPVVQDAQVKLESDAEMKPPVAAAAVPQSMLTPSLNAARIPEIAKAEPSLKSDYEHTSLVATDINIARQAAAALLNRRTQNLTRLARLKQRVDKDRFDGDAWLDLIADATTKGDLDRTREVYEGFLSAFPDNAQQWIAYADLEISHGNNAKVIEIFGRCLRSSPSVQLWHFYLNYIRRTNPIDRSSAERAATARDTITKAFEFSLAHVGVDLDAGVIWHDYIEFLKEGGASTTWEEQIRMDKLRQTYQRAVCIPLGSVEQIWRDYDAFETTTSKATAKKFLQDRSPAYMAARTVSRELQKRFGGIQTPSVPPKPDWHQTMDQMQIRLWKELVAYEESDPLELSDPAALYVRLSLVYKKAIACLRFYPEIWYLAATFAAKNNKMEEAATLFKAGATANPLSLLLHYAYIEHEESRGNVAECNTLFSDLTDRLSTEVDGNINQTKQDIDTALEEKQKSENERRAQKKQNEYGSAGDFDNLPNANTLRQEAENITRAITESYGPRLETLRRLCTSAWIMYMRFARRAEGIKQSRAIFSKARKWQHITWHAFVASALLELHWNKEVKIAANIFELGSKRFGEEVDFVSKHLDFLLTNNDESNARLVFERTISKIPAERARPLWQRWAEYEYTYGELASIQKLDTRLAEVYPDAAPISRFAQRHTYLDLDEISQIELGSKTTPSSTFVVRSESIPAMTQGLDSNFNAPPAIISHPEPPAPTSIMDALRAQRAGPPDNSHHIAMHNISRGPPSVDGSIGSAQRSNRGAARRRRSPSPQRRGPPSVMSSNAGNNNNRRAPSPPRISRHTPPIDFPEGIPWLMSQLPSKTVFAPHGPILDINQLIHILMTSHLPQGPDQRGRNRSISPQRRMAGEIGRRRSPDYNMRGRR